MLFIPKEQFPPVLQQLVEAYKETIVYSNLSAAAILLQGQIVDWYWRQRERGRSFQLFFLSEEIDFQDYENDTGGKSTYQVKLVMNAHDPTENGNHTYAYAYEIPPLLWCDSTGLREFWQEKHGCIEEGEWPAPPEAGEETEKLLHLKRALELAWLQEQIKQGKEIGKELFRLEPEVQVAWDQLIEAG